MNKYVNFALGMFLLILLIKTSHQVKAQEKAADSRTLQVKVHYSGSGTVDEKHKIFVELWDTPDFMQGNARPVVVKPAVSKDDTVTFSGFAASPAYVTAAYDPTGNYDGESGPPPAGSSLGMYSKTPGKPEPINVETGKTVQIDLTFDDTTKMQ